MRFGLQIPNFTYPGVPDDRLFERVADIAVTAERSGFDSVWVMDHFYQIGFNGPPTDPMLEAYTLLGAIAARTSTVELGTMVTGVTYRNPAHLAKIVTTLDVISAGRAVLGIGAAWNEEEHRGYGFAFPPVRERMERLEEALQICRAMFTEEAPSLVGRHSRIDHALNVPRPIRPGGIPIMIGGSGEQRTLKLVATYADACNLFGDVPTIRHKLDVLARHCEAVGRDPAQIVKTRLGPLVVADSDQELRRLTEEGRAARGVTEEQFRAVAVIGRPDQVAEQARAYLDAGLDGLLFNLRNAHEVDPVALAGQALAPLFASS